MPDGFACCGTIVQIINIGITVASIVVLAMIYNKTETDLIKDFDDKHPNFINDTLPKASPPFQLYLDEEKYCQCGEEILDNICTEEQIISGCYDVSKNNERPLLRNLDDIRCSEIHQNLVSYNKFSYVFDIGFDTVHKMALGLLVIIGCTLASLFIIDLILFSSFCCQEGAVAMLIGCSCCIITVFVFGGTADLVCLIIMLVNFYKGNTTGTFMDYYEKCNESLPFKNGDFNELYEKLSNVYSLMAAFIALNFVQMAFNYVGLCCLGCFAPALDKEDY